MSDMSIQDRYDEIVELSGVSEQVIRRVLKATRQSLARSLKKGDRATLPGICTIYPEVRTKINPGGQSSTHYIKLKARASSALETEFDKIESFEKEVEKEENISDKLNFSDVSIAIKDRYSNNNDGIRTAQISALM